MRAYLSPPAITRKRLTEEKKLNQGLERFTNLQQKHVHEKEAIVNKRKDQNISTEQNFKDVDRKVQLTTWVECVKYMYYYKQCLVHDFSTSVNSGGKWNYQVRYSFKDIDQVPQYHLTLHLLMFHSGIVVLRRHHCLLTTCCSNDLARQYRTKVSELELRRIELNRLSEEFEAKMRRKEVGFSFISLYSQPSCTL